MRLHLKGLTAYVGLFAGVLGSTDQLRAGPVIDSITGTAYPDYGVGANGLILPQDTTVGWYTIWANARVVHDIGRDASGSPWCAWTIRGSGFGSQPGTVTLAGRAVEILSWSSDGKTIRV